jgi:DNA topoisomerase I
MAGIFPQSRKLCTAIFGWVSWAVASCRGWPDCCFQAVVVQQPLEPHASAAAAGLRYVNDGRMAGIRRLGHTRVRYVDPDGRAVTNADVLRRIKSLAVPPAWTHVWICPHPLGHVQATGRDARGRKQYRYHPQWREARDEVKYGRLLEFAAALPALRARVAADLQRTGLPRERVLATVVSLLEKTLIRVGNEEYARANRSYGLTTLRNGHAKVSAGTIRFEFRGKSGINHSVGVQDARLARIVKACRDLPGYELFQYLDENGERCAVGSADVNDYLRQVCGEAFTAKDFRTWAGTVLVARALADAAPADSVADGKRTIVRAIEVAAQRLGNTVAVCRKSYVHPTVVEGFLEGDVIGPRRPSSARARRLSGDEAAVARLIERRTRASRRAAKKVA